MFLLPGSGPAGLEGWNMTMEEKAAPLRQAAGAARCGDELRLAQILVAHVFGVSPEMLLRAPRLDRQAVLARQVAMYLAHVVLGVALVEVGRAFARDRTTARHACSRIETLREDARNDRLINWLEAMLRHAVCVQLLSANKRGLS